MLRASDSPSEALSLGATLMGVMVRGQSDTTSTGHSGALLTTVRDSQLADRALDSPPAAEEASLLRAYGTHIRQMACRLETFWNENFPFAFYFFL